MLRLFLAFALATFTCWYDQTYHPDWSFLVYLLWAIIAAVLVMTLFDKCVKPRRKEQAR